MSIRTGVFTKYVIELPGLSVSNDIWSGDVCIDADVTVKMSRWTAGTSFTITLYDLPDKQVEALKGAADPGLLAAVLPSSAPATGQVPPKVTVRLGYLDTSTDVVLEGVFTSVESAASGDKLVTTIKGQETVAYACQKTKVTRAMPKEAKSYPDVVNELLKDLPDWAGKKATVDLPDAKPLTDMKFAGTTVLKALEELANKADAELLIADATVFLGAPIKNDKVAPNPVFAYGKTLATFEKKHKLGIAENDDDDAGAPTKPADKEVAGFGFTVVGDPGLRPGQSVTVSNIDKYAGEFRIRDVTHSFTTNGGYSCVGQAAAPVLTGKAARKIDSSISAGADSAVRQIDERIQSRASTNPPVEIGAVKATADNYRADLYYAQAKADKSETQASVNVAIETDEDHVYRAKPIASPFAWNKTGLVTPVYPGMKAVILHNRASATDGIVAGYSWSKDPNFAPPSNQDGDWWLCLPVDLEGSGPPTDATKAANDLTGKSGKRVIEVKGLRITVGSGKLATVGGRPSEGGDDEILIEHASGTQIHIDASGNTTIDSKGSLNIASAGNMTIDASQASLTIKGKVAINGSLDIS